MSTASQTPHRKLWEERSSVLAFILAVLVPGLGHLYQGRILKGLIYMVGILGLFCWGVTLGEGVVVYNLPEQGIAKRITLHYAAQLAAGAVSYPALFQRRRMNSGDNQPVRQLEKPLNAHFTGRLKASDTDSTGGKLDGTVHLKPDTGDFGSETKGSFSGTLDGQPIELPLAGNFFLDRPIAAGFNRAMAVGVAGDDDPNGGRGKMILGSIPRSIIDGYGVPPDSKELQEVTGRLGKLHELALVFTWIAGLLNVLAIWDCVQGPAYGFGDEQWSDSSGTDTANPNKADNPAPLNKAPSPA